MNLVAEFRLTKKRSLIYNITAGLIFAAGFFIFLLAAVYERSGRLADYILNDHDNVIMFSFTGLVIIVHELFHALGYTLYGGKVKYGMKLLNIYTMDISGCYYTTVQMLVIMLLPAVVIGLLLLISLLILPQYVYYIFIGMLFNISGSAGDIFMSCFLIRNGMKCKVRDTENGFNIYSDVNHTGGTKTPASINS